MPDKTVEVDAVNLARQLTLTVKLTRVRQWQTRLWLGGWLLVLAAWVMGTGLRIEGIEDLGIPGES